MARDFRQGNKLILLERGTGQDGLSEAPVARAEQGRGGVVTIVIPKADALDGSDLLIGVMAMLETLLP